MSHPNLHNFVVQEITNNDEYGLCLIQISCNVLLFANRSRQIQLFDLKIYLFFGLPGRFF